MSLAGVLSSMRELILDSGSLPSTFKERCSLYQNKFPNLLQAEIEDLAKMEPERLGIYTHSIFGGERGLLTNLFPMSFALLERVWPKVYERKFSGFEFARELHKRKPWKDNTTIGLAENFVEAISVEFSKVLGCAPEIRDIALMELVTLKVKRHPCKNVRELEQIREDEMLAMNVESLMLRQVIVTPGVMFQEFNYDVVSARNYFYSHRRELPESMKRGPVFSVCARDGDNVTVWHVFPRDVFVLLQTKLSIAVEKLAETFLDPNNNRTETESFNEFFSFFIGLIRAGVIYLEAPVLEH